MFFFLKILSLFGSRAMKKIILSATDINFYLFYYKRISNTIASVVESKRDTKCAYIIHRKFYLLQYHRGAGSTYDIISIHCLHWVLPQCIVFMQTSTEINEKNNESNFDTKEKTKKFFAVQFHSSVYWRNENQNKFHNDFHELTTRW